MKATFKSTYVSKKGNDTFRYAVTGTAEELAAYKTAQGVNYREDDITGEPLFFTVRYAGKSVNLITTKSGNVIADLSELKASASIAKQFGGNLGQSIADAAAAQFLFGGGAPVPQAVTAPVIENGLDS
jgi:hypothetical protein